MKSLHSKDLVMRKFNWQWFYYFLTDAGIEALREQLYLPSQVAGGALGVVVANLMFEADPVAFSETERTGGGLILDS